MPVAEVDLKLLLAIQYVCEKSYIAVPWDDVALVMGPATTGSGILDYLATTRTRMVARGLDVPPPLNFPGRTEKVNRNSPDYPNSSDDNDEAWVVDDSDIKYGEPMTKRAKMSTKGSIKRKVRNGTDDPGTLYKESLVISPTPVKKDVNEAVAHNRKVVDTNKSGSRHHHKKDDHVKDGHVKDHHAEDHQTKGLDGPPPLNFPGKMKIDFLISPTSTKKDVPTTIVQKRRVVTNDNSFSGAHGWSMGNPISHSYQSGLRGRFEQRHERYPDPSNHTSWNRR